MEKDGDNVMVVAAATAISPAKSEGKKKKKAKKKSSSFSIIRATLIAIRRFFSRNKPRIGKEIAMLKPSNGGDGVLKGLGFVGTVRPLCLQADQLRRQSLPPLLPPPPPSGHEAPFHDMCPPPAAPSPSHEDCMSRYASAEDLQALDEPAEEEGGGGRGDDGAPKVVDEWAEEFIARFYQQMSLQRQNSVDDREEKTIGS